MYYFITYFALFLGIVPLVILFSKKRAFIASEPIMPFLWLTFIATLYEHIGSTLLKINTAYWFQLYSLLEFLTIYYFFYKHFQFAYKKNLKLIIALFLCVYVISLLFWNPNNILISEAINRIPLTLFIFTFSFIWFKKLFQKMEIENPLDDSTFYFVSGLAIYYSGTSILFLISSIIFESNLYFYNFWTVNVLATLFLRIFLIIGVWKMERE